MNPVENSFTYNVFFAYLDLDELESVFDGRWLWSTSRTAVARFRRDDHFGSPDESLSDSVRKLVEEQTGERPSGPIRVLTQLRFFGYMMNPVSFFYCFDAAGTKVESVVAEVTNTPWGEQHCYVLDQASLAGTGSNTRKEFHVSPFMQMNMEYSWKVGTPGEALSLHIDEPEIGVSQQTRPFDVTMKLQRRPISTLELAKTLARHPFMTGKIAAAIYWQALKLWWKGCPFVPHPSRTGKAGSTEPSSERDPNRSPRITKPQGKLEACPTSARTT